MSNIEIFFIVINRKFLKTDSKFKCKNLVIGNDEASEIIKVVVSFLVPNVIIAFAFDHFAFGSFAPSGGGRVL